MLLLFKGLGADPLPNNDKLKCGCVECRLCNELDVGELLVGANGDELDDAADPLPFDELLPVNDTGDGANGDALLVGDSRE